MLSVKINMAGMKPVPGSVDRILPRFEVEARELLVSAVHELLGSADIYSLSEAHAKVKSKRPGFKRFPGKADDQPLIFSGEMFEGVKCDLEGESTVVKIDADHGVSPERFDYAEKWEEATQFLEKALALVEPKLAGILPGIIMEEMGLQSTTRSEIIVAVTGIAALWELKTGTTAVTAALREAQRVAESMTRAFAPFSRTVGQAGAARQRQPKKSTYSVRTWRMCARLRRAARAAA